MTPKQLINRINKAIKNEELDFYTDETSLKFNSMPTNTNETIACVMREWAINWLYVWNAYYDEPYFRTDHSDSDLEDVLKNKLYVTGMYMVIKGKCDSIVYAEIQFPEYDENEPFETYIRQLIADFLLTITNVTKDFNVDYQFSEYYDPSRRDVSPRDLLNALEEDEKYFQEISKNAYAEYKKYRL